MFKIFYDKVYMNEERKIVLKEIYDYLENSNEEVLSYLSFFIFSIMEQENSLESFDIEVRNLFFKLSNKKIPKKLINKLLLVCL
jgi:hypothetical protein